MPRTRLAAPLLAAALVLAACGGPDGSERSAGAAQVSGSGEPLGFTAPDVRGGQVAGADFVGQDVVIWFWAPW